MATCWTWAAPNGYLLECLCKWGEEKGLRLTPYGVGLGADLIELAKQRLPEYAGHFWSANAWEWIPPRKFRYVYTLPDNVPESFRREYFSRLLEHFVEPGGLLIVGGYGSRKQSPAWDITAMLEQLGFPVAGSSRCGDVPLSHVAWVRKAKPYIDDVADYYAALAPEYDVTAGYTDAEAEGLREPIKARFRQAFRSRNVLEIACGTGYWTEVVGEAAASVLALDITPAALTQAQARCSRLPHVRFQIADAYTLEGVRGDFDAAFAHWWWSHMPRARVRDFLSSLHAKLAPGALVLFRDHLPRASTWRRVTIPTAIASSGECSETGGLARYSRTSRASTSCGSAFLVSRKAFATESSPRSKAGISHTP